ncbi:6510_t:CDS:2 [Paraglomus brasilianum]|uniref:6510_t:CDS:1 n=1 Tax=Paraglomus brasilianum TaxID=144538 RepID=A0A9N8WAF5_9GLOM|nr:6510_t:CDS:2 [Paraglomus brasilianum]
MKPILTRAEAQSVLGFANLYNNNWRLIADEIYKRIGVRKTPRMWKGMYVQTRKV